MQYTAPPGSTDPNASYVTGNAITKVKGSPVPAEAVEHPQREIVNVISEAGLTPSGNDLTQLYAAIVDIIDDRTRDQILDCSTAGAVAAKTVAVDDFVLFRGKNICVSFAAFNTADNPTLNVGDTGDKAIHVHGFPAQIGDLVAGRVYRLVYDGVVWQVVGGLSPFRLCEVVYMSRPGMPPGFVGAAGGLIANAATQYPAAFAYLQTTEGQALCVTEAEWQALSRATYYTNAAGAAEGWNGVGGVTKFVLDAANGTIRVPDLRGMYMEAAGLDSLVVGGVHCDKIRNLSGYTHFLSVSETLGIMDGSYGIQRHVRVSRTYSTLTKGTGTATSMQLTTDSSRTVPDGQYITPRAFGVLPCVYLGS